MEFILGVICGAIGAVLILLLIASLEVASNADDIIEKEEDFK